VRDKGCERASTKESSTTLFFANRSDKSQIPPRATGSRKDGALEPTTTTRGLGRIGQMRMPTIIAVSAAATRVHPLRLPRVWLRSLGRVWMRSAMSVDFTGLWRLVRANVYRAGSRQGIPEEILPPHISKVPAGIDRWGPRHQREGGC